MAPYIFLKASYLLAAKLRRTLDIVLITQAWVKQVRRKNSPGTTERWETLENMALEVGLSQIR